MSVNCKHPTCYDSPVCRRKPKEKKVYRIPKQSESFKKRMKLYRPKAKKFIEDNIYCKIRLKGCTGKAQGVHHVRGKITLNDLLDDKDWLPACNHCNTLLEQKDSEARALGFKKSKFSKK